MTVSVEDVKLLPAEISQVLGKYDYNLRRRAEQGCLGETELICYNRFLDDLELSKKPEYPFCFDTKAIKKMMRFAALLTVYDESGKPNRLNLYPVQRFIVSQIYGWKHKDSGLLRYRESYIQIARRNGKSFTSSFLGLYFMMLSPYRSERGIIFSAKLDLAMIAFRQYCAFLDADKDLGELFKYSKVNGNSSCLGTDNFLEVFSGAKNADGFSSGWALADELALQDGELYQLILDGQANFSSAQLIGITTAGFGIGLFCHELYKGLRKLLYANKLDDKNFVMICEPDDEDDISDWHTWAKSNPVLFFTREGELRPDKIDLYQTKFNAAVRQGGKQLNSFITKQINRFNAQNDTLMCNFDLLQAARYDFTFADVVKLYKDSWYLGIDLAQILDLNSVCWATWIYLDENNKLLPPEEKARGRQKLYINHTNYIPAATLSRHIQTDKFAYQNYLEKELWLTQGGNGQRTDYAEILAHIKSIKEEHGLHFITISCDPFGCATIQQGLADICEYLIMQSQSHKALSPYIEQFNGLVAGDEIALSKDSCAIFLRAVINSVVCYDNQGYAYITKPTAENAAPYRVDPCDALLDCLPALIADRNKDRYSLDDAITDWASIYD